MVIPLLLAALLAQEPERRMTATFQDRTRGIDFQLKEDGSVILKAPDPASKEKREIKTWEAKSAKEFKEKHPELVREYELEPFLSPLEKSPFAMEDFDRIIQEAMKEFSRAWRLEERREGAGDRGPRIGLLVTAVPAALKSHLKLKDGEGLLVADVQEGSPAAKAGIVANDLILELDGKPVGDIAAFIRDVKPLLEKGPFALTILHEGERKRIEFPAEPKPLPPS